MNEFIENICLFSVCIFFFLWPVSFASITSLPVLVFIALLCLDFRHVCNVVRHFKIEILAFIAILVLGTVFSELPLKSVKGSYDVLRGSVVFIAVIVLCQGGIEKLRKPFFLAGVISFVVFLVAAIICEMSTDHTINSNRIFINSYFGNYNHYSTGVAQLSLLNAFFLFDKNSSRLVKAISFLTGGVSLLCLLWIGSRGSFLALISGLFLYAILSLPGKRLWVSAGAITTVSLFFAAIYFKFASVVIPSWDRGKIGSINIRFEMFLASVTSTWEKAKFFGFGINTYKYLEFGQADGAKLIMPHNVFVELFFSVGLCGLVLSIFFFLRFAYKLYKQDMSNQFFGFLALSFCFFWVVRGLVDLKLFSTYLPGVISFTLAMLYLSRSPSAELLTRYKAKESI